MNTGRTPMRWLAKLRGRTAPADTSDRAKRYEEFPILRIMECYALDVIGHLSPEQTALVAKVVRHTWGGDEWRTTVRQVLAWPVELDDEIRHNWRRYQEAAARTSRPDDYGPAGFAIAFADEFGPEPDRGASAAR